MLTGMGAAVIGGSMAGGAAPAKTYDHPDDLYAALTAGPATTLRFGGGVIDVVFADGGVGLNRALVLDWIKIGAEAMVGYFGQFPVARYGLLVVAQPGNRVGHATTYGYRGTATRITVGVDADAHAFAQDWVLVHELCHGALPNLPREALWVQEGNATYIEPIARACVGQLSVAEVWRQAPAKCHAIAGEHRVQVIDLGKQIAGAGVECASVLRQLHAARRAVQEPDTDSFLQLSDCCRSPPLLDAQAVSRAGEAPHVRDC